MQLLTPAGLAGIAVVRATHADRASLVALLRTSSGALFDPGPGAAPRKAVLTIDGTALDDVLVVDRGSLGLEVHLHGASAVLDAIGERVGLFASPPVTPAESLLQRALCEEQLELAIEQKNLDVGAFAASLCGLTPRDRAAEFAAFQRRSRIARALASPQRLVLAGRQNAGKSTLFNALLFRERALTGPQPGLTRDPIAECTVLDGYPYELVDTAGEGPAPSAVDELALASARRARLDADVVLVVDAAAGPTATDRELAANALLVVVTKADLPAAAWPDEMPRHACVSVLTDGPAAARTWTGRALRERRGLPPAGRVGGVAALDAGQEALVAAAAGWGG